MPLPSYHPIVQTIEESPITTSRKAPSRALIFWGAAAVVVVLDQVTKVIVRASLGRGEAWPEWDLPFRLRHVTNTGAAFGILEDQTAFLIVMAVIGLGAIYLYYRNPPFNHWTASVGIGLLLGGALGNLIDRVRLGRVTDFFDPDSFPAFNVADSAINIGIAVLVVGYLVWGSREQTSEPANQQTGEVASQQTSGAANQQTSEGADPQTIEVTNQQTIEVANSEPDAGTPPHV